MVDYNNVAVPLLKSKKIVASKDLMATPPYLRIIKLLDIERFIPNGALFLFTRVDQMENYIRVHGLAAAVLVDEEGKVIAGHDLVISCIRGRSNIAAFVLPFSRRDDKEALQAAYDKVTSKSGVRK